MQQRMDFFFEKTYPLSCFYWFLYHVYFLYGQHARTIRQKSTKSLTHKKLHNWHIMIAIAFWVTFGNSCVTQNSWCIVFLILFVCSTSTAGHNIMTQEKIVKHTQYYIFFHTKTLQNSVISIFCQRKQMSLILNNMNVQKSMAIVRMVKYLPF